jgi:hypothetical protein
MTRATGTGRTGRPPKLNTVVWRSEDGQKSLTAGERIVQAIRAGNYVEAAAAMAGVNKTTVYEWLKVGATVVDALEGGARRADFKQHQLDCADFSNAVAAAEGAAEVEAVALVDKIASGGVVTTTTTTKTKAGDVVEVATRVETSGPDFQALAWRLERRHPDRWGRRRLEVTGKDGEAIPVETRVAGLVDALRAFQQGDRPAPAPEGDDQAGEG